MSVEKATLIFMDSILNTVKSIIGITPDYECFDDALIVHTNTVLAELTMMGVGDPKGFIIEDQYATWSDYTRDKSLLVMVKSYVPLKVKMLFDPPTSSPIENAINANLSELEWRINDYADYSKSFDETGPTTNGPQGDMLEEDD